MSLSFFQCIICSIDKACAKIAIKNIPLPKGLPQNKNESIPFLYKKNSKLIGVYRWYSRVTETKIPTIVQKSFVKISEVDFFIYITSFIFIYSCNKFYNFLYVIKSIYLVRLLKYSLLYKAAESLGLVFNTILLYIIAFSVFPILS